MATSTMVTIYLRYVLDTRRLKEFEHYGKLWIALVEKFGGKHHGYFMPGEGASNIALALFIFDSLASYESYRQRSFEDPDCQAAFRYAEETRCILSYERSFFPPRLFLIPIPGVAPTEPLNCLHGNFHGRWRGARCLAGPAGAGP